MGGWVGRRRHGYKSVPKNVLRHVVLSELGGELRVNLAGEFVNEVNPLSCPPSLVSGWWWQVIRSYDPLPPPDSRCDYDLAAAAAGPAGRNGFLDGLIRSLLPNYTPETAAAGILIPWSFVRHASGPP